MQYFTFNVYFLYLGQCRRQDALWPDSWTDSWTRKEAGLRLQRTLDQKTRVWRHLSLGQAKFSLLFASFYLADAPCLRLCGSLIIITIMLKWQNGKLCAKCIKFIANWPGQWQNRFVFVIVSVSALLAHVFFFLRISRFRCCTDRRSKVEPKKPNTITMLATCGGRSRFSCAGQWIGRSASGYHGHPQWVVLTLYGIHNLFLNNSFNKRTTIWMQYIKNFYNFQSISRLTCQKCIYFVHIIPLASGFRN